MPVFRTPFEQYAHRDGQHCKILRELDNSEKDPEVGTMYKIQFDDGEIIDAFDGEVVNA